MRALPDRGTVRFCYAHPPGFSGQRAATETVIQGLAARGWKTLRLPQPVFTRGSGDGLAPARYGLGLLGSWLRALSLVVARDGWLCVNLGQTRTALIRDAVPLLLGRLGLGRARVVVSLHGSLFMQWADNRPEYRLFRLLLRHCGAATVLGERQKERLIALGMPSRRIRILVNSCDLEPLTHEAVLAKHAPGGGHPVRLLHLSSLIDTKGFPEYVEALASIATRPGPAVEAVVCGRAVASEFADRFADALSAERWLQEKIQQINLGARARLTWIRGAMGSEKADLFRRADIFVLPTRYAVEAQPLVLLEAMASGCAIVTTRAGEIPTILDEETAVFLDEVSAAAVSASVESLLADPARRQRLGAAAHARFVAEFAPARHIDAWEALLGAQFAPKATA